MSEQRAPEWTEQPAGYRLPDELTLGRVVLQVADVARSIRYYESVIGLRALTNTSTRAELGAHGDDRVLVELRARANARPVPRSGRLGLYHFALLLPNRAHLGRFIAHLGRAGVHAGSADHLVSEALYLTDPDGLGIEVYADRPRSSWQVLQNGTLAMATDPLDLRSLASSVGDEEGNGAPAGTVIGHVHLFVDDLSRASRFFHEAAGLDRIRLAFPGALFMSAGGYHHHLGTNTWAAHAPVATDEDARLIEWTMNVPAASDVQQAASSIAAAGYEIGRDGDDAIATDPWGTRLRITVR